MFNPTIFDIETDGLTPTKIHCMSWSDDAGKTVYCTENYGRMRDILAGAELLCGHNIQRYDIPVLERLLDIKIEAKLVDTLALSWYLFPDRPRHGLESWGVDVGIHKLEIDDWENLTVDQYRERCNGDVGINCKLFELEFEKLRKLYPNEEDLDKLLQYMWFKLDCAREQERNGWKLDVPKAANLLETLLEEKEIKTKALAEAMPKIPITKVVHKPAGMYKKNGELSIAAHKWLAVCDNPQSSEDITCIVDWEDGNPNSHVQIKDWLFHLGWKPVTFDFKRDKQTNEIKKIPQIQDKSGEENRLCDSVVALFKKCPELKLLDGLAVLSHRISILKGFLENVDERGFIKAEVQGLTNTLRFKHRTVVNLPSVDREYGADIRGCLVAPDGYELAGSDMSSLEDRTKQHYIYEFDPEYVKEMMAPGFDPHLDLAESAGAVDENQVRLYKEHGDANIKRIRHLYKQGNYASTYGARPKRIALTLGCTLKKATEIFDAYWKRNWAINKVAESQYVNIIDGEYWLYNPVSKFFYSLRCPKDIFSTLNQGTGVYCFDTYLKYVRRNGPPIIGQFHDEWIGVIKPENEGRLKEHVRRAIKATNDELRLNRELSAELNFGPNYSNIH